MAAIKIMDCKMGVTFLAMLAVHMCCHIGGAISSLAEVVGKRDVMIM